MQYRKSWNHIVSLVMIALIVLVSCGNFAAAERSEAAYSYTEFPLERNGIVSGIRN